jgi:hypothetical protein
MGGHWGDLIKVFKMNRDIGQMAELIAILVNDYQKNGLTMGVINCRGIIGGVGRGACCCFGL